MNTILSILTELHPEVDFETETALIDRDILDSFDIVSLVAEIDARCGIVIPPEALTPDNLNSAAAIFDLLQRLSENGYAGN